MLSDKDKAFFEIAREAINYEELEDTLVSRLGAKYPGIGLGELRKLAYNIVLDFDEHLHKEFKS